MVTIELTVEDAGRTAGALLTVAALTSDEGLRQLASDIREQVTGQPLIPRE